MKVNCKEVKEKIFLLRTMAMSNSDVRETFEKVQEDERCAYIMKDLERIHPNEVLRYNEIIQNSRIIKEDKEKLLIKK